jgi:hypothetical protein
MSFRWVLLEPLEVLELLGVLDELDEPEGVELEEDVPEDDAVPLGELEEDEELLLEGVAEADDEPEE